MIRIGEAWFHDHASIRYSKGYSDTFIYNVEVRGGLPPGDYAPFIRRLCSKLAILRRGGGCLWVRHNAPGKWFSRELKRTLMGIPVPFAANSLQPLEQDYSFPIRTFHEPSLRPPEIPYEDFLIGEGQNVLRCLARLTQAYTAEIASLSGYSLSWTRNQLQELAKMKLVYRLAADSENNLNLPAWHISKAGLWRVLRSWAWPPEWHGINRQERHSAVTGPKHKRISRLWPAWVEKSYPSVTIHAGWSEMVIYRYGVTPDALVWGDYQGEETLFWLEVESGHSSAMNDSIKLNRRLAVAHCYAEDLRVKLIYAVLGPTWVCQAARDSFRALPGDVAVIINEWDARFGSLPPIRWGLVTV
jgi:hypothetical protein